ncbi:unnamed protein product [Discula destructiva]
MPSVGLIFVYLVGLAVAGLLKLSVNKRKFAKTYKLPPQVEAPPIVGNSFQVPQFGAGAWASARADEYGEMFTLQVGSKTMVFLNSPRVVNDLMEKRAKLYSSRGPAPFAFNCMTDANSVLFMPYGDTWRALRKGFHTVLKGTNMPSFAPYQELETKQYLRDLLHHPEKWALATKRYSNSVIMNVVSGRRVEDMDDPALSELFHLTEAAGNSLRPGAHLVDSFPALDRIIPEPLKWWKPEGLQFREAIKRIFGKLAKETLEAYERGENMNCFINQFYHSKDGQNLSNDMKLFMINDFIQGGTDTTYVSSSIIKAGLALNPRCIARARQELDAVCGTGEDVRLPTFEDRQNLPYVSAIVKEAIRWRPILRIGLPHALTEDDEYEGYKFPAGTLFTWNAWHIAQNDEGFEDPKSFKPERFLTADVDSPLKGGHLNYGPGRRVCPGFHVADTNLWILTARLVYCFNIAEDPDHPIDTIEDTELLRIQHLAPGDNPYHLKITPRSAEHRALIEKEAATVK